MSTDMIAIDWCLFRHAISFPPPEFVALFGPPIDHRHDVPDSMDQDLAD